MLVKLMRETSNISTFIIIFLNLLVLACTDTILYIDNFLASM